LVSPVYALYGQRNLMQVAAEGQTNDRGEYRLFGVPPGRYYLSANPTSRLSGLNPLPPSAANNKYPRTYHPSTTDISAAGEIEIRPGAEIDGVDIRLTPHTTYRIRGRVIDSATGQAPQNANVSMIPHDFDLLTRGILPSSPVAYNTADGTFEADDVLPGSYWISASFGPAPAGKVVSQSPAAAAAVEVVDADVDDLVLTARPPLTIAGRIRIEGQDSGAALNSMSIRLATSPGVTRLGILPPPAQIDAAGRFQFENVTPGEYQLYAPDLGLLSALGTFYSEGRFYPKEARFGSLDVLSNPLVISGTNSGELEILLAQDRAQITGTVLDDQRQPVPLSPVVLFQSSLSGMICTGSSPLMPVATSRCDRFRPEHIRSLRLPLRTCGHFSIPG